MSLNGGESPDLKTSDEDDSHLVLTARRQRLFDFAICLGLLLAIAAVYAQVAGFDFVSFDDPAYIQDPHIQAGLTVSGIKWALTAIVVSNWLPVTLLSYMLDVQLFGVDSGAQHLVNVLLHALSALLLYAALRRATNVRGLSAFVSFIFALHPLHVESVAWIGERKDVLSAFFWFLALYAYVRYTERPGMGRYLAVVVPFCLGLMAKPMVVTFPFTLFLFDLWPLRRTYRNSIILEKLPLIALSAVASLLAFSIQKSNGAIVSSTLLARAANASITYVLYIAQTFWPQCLACYYPFPSAIVFWKAAGAAAAVLVVTVFAIRVWRTHPYFTAGWLWYVGTLVPVIGLVQVGNQSHADRYMYIPMVGLLIALAWGASDLLAKGKTGRLALTAFGIVSCVACTLEARSQTAYWENSGTLYQNAIDSTGKNEVAENNLGEYLMKSGQPANAATHFNNAIQINPTYALAENNMGVAVEAFDGCAAALPHYQTALHLKPGYAEADFNIGRCLTISQQSAGAIPYFEDAIRSKPNYGETYFQMGSALSRIPGREAEALKNLEVAAHLLPSDALVQRTLGEFLAKLGRTKEAITPLEAAQAIEPNGETAKMLQHLRAAR